VGAAVDILDQFFTWQALPGHVAYAIIAVSYLLTNIFWLRVAAVVGIGFEIVYFIVSGSPVWTSMAWDAVFILINLVQVVRLLRDRLSLRLTPDQRAFIAPIVGDLDKAQIAQLLRTGDWRTLEAGTQLTAEGEPVSDLTFICEGRTEVRVRGLTVAHVTAGSFIGDVSFTTGAPATATVVADQPSRVLAFDQGRLKALCAKDGQIASALYRRIGGDLAGKMRDTTGRL
jgi:CRP-like cAMP-binding protein